MSLKTFSIVFSLLFFFVLSASATKVTVEGRKLLVDGSPFTIKAVGYSPVPIGQDPTTTPPYGDYFTSNNDSFYLRDIPIIKALGANTIRLWGWNISADHTDFLDLAAANKLYVIPTFYMGPGTYPNLADPAVISRVTADFKTFLDAIKNHPAILFYLIGEDLNADWNYGPERDALYSLIDKLAAYGLSTQPANGTRPFSSALNDQHGVPDIVQYEASTPNVWIWSLNVYRGCTFKGLINQFATVSKRVLFVSEFGVDAFNDQRSAVDEASQAKCVLGLWEEITNGTAAVGGSVTEYQDEWWKGKLAQNDARHPGCPSYNASAHTTCGYPNADFPDGYANQAWFGIVDEDYGPREAFQALQKLWDK